MDDPIWLIVPPRGKSEIIASELGIPLPIARILENRGLGGPEEAAKFLFDSVADLPDPLGMKGMDRAVERIRQAIWKKEKILVFGDYDADGALSVVMLLRALRSLGGEVDYYIPHRLREGYGLKEKHIQMVKERGSSLVITVDCGIKATSFARKAREEGVDVIVTDHHLPGQELPDVVAILNPVLVTSGYPSRNLTGVGVVFKLLQALLGREGKGAHLSHYTKLVAIGTIADVAELTGENRILVKDGLRSLGSIANRGLRTLMESCGLSGKRVNEADVGFRIAPRINAAGRMETADLVVRLFLAQQEDEITALVRRLEGLNAARQAEEERILNEARGRIEASRLADRYKVLILGCEGWHRGVIGIVASKLKDVFHRPVLLFDYDGHQAFGSGRSIPEFSLIDCLDECGELFDDYGGHRLAVGCVLSAERMEVLRSRVNALAQVRLGEDDLRKKLWIDTRLDFPEITIPFLESFFRLAPFGNGNPWPLFFADRVEIQGSPQLLQERHLKMTVRQNGKTFEAIGWDKAAWANRLPTRGWIRLVYSLHMSPFMGEEKITLSIEGLKAQDG